MCEVRLKKADTIMPVVKELLNSGNRVRITVTGMSMYPFLRENKDSVELMRTDFSKLRSGDIVLVRRSSSQYVLHRIIRKKKTYIYLNGDAQQWCEGPIFPEQIMGKVIKVWRKEKGIDCSDKAWRRISCLWRILFPFRYFIIHFYIRIRPILKKNMET